MSKRTGDSSSLPANKKRSKTTRASTTTTPTTEAAFSTSSSTTIASNEPNNSETIDLIPYFNALNDYSASSEITAEWIKNISETILSRAKTTPNSTLDSHMLCLFKNIITKSGSNNETIVLTLIENLNDELAVRVKSACQFLLSHSISALNAWNPANFCPFISHLFRLLSTCDLERATAYNVLINLFAKIDTKSSKYLSNKQNYFRAQKLFISEVKNSLGNHSNYLANAFKRIFEGTGSKMVLNEFIFTLYITTINVVREQYQQQINDLYMETLEKQIELMLGLKRGAWMESCLLSQSKCDIKQMYSLCRFNQMIQYDTDGGENVTSAIIKFTIRILDAYGIEINEFHHKSSNDLYLNFTLLARAFLEDLFKRSREAREMILSQYLSKCFESFDKKAVYINQLDILLNSQFAIKKLFGAQNIEERKKLNVLVMNRLCSHAPTTSKSKNAAHQYNLLMLNNKLTVSLIDAMRLFICTSDKMNNVHISDKVNNYGTLFTFLKENALKNTCTETRKTSILCLSSMLKALNRDIFASKSLPDIGHQMNREQIIHNNNASSILLIQTLKQIISSPLCPLIKTDLYESFYSLIKDNTLLIHPICEILLHQIEPYICTGTTTATTSSAAATAAPITPAYLDVAKCLSTDHDDNNNNNELRLIEPLDVLFHCALLCVDEASKTGVLQGSQIIRSLKDHVDAIVTSYSNNDARVIFELYKESLSAKIKKQRTTASFKIVHQIELGIIDSVVEHIFQNDIYGEMSKIMEKYEQTSSLISTEIENLVSEALSMNKQTQQEDQKNNERKRKLDSKGQSNNKKLKASDDKENQPPSTSTIQTRSAASRSRNPLGNVNVNIPQQAAAPPPPPPPRVQSNRQEQQRQTAQPKQQPPPQQKQQQHQQHLLLQNLSFANIQFEHQYRISNRSILKMVNILFGHKYDSKLFTTQVLTNVVLLVSDEKFTQYMIKVVERKLKTMLASTTNKIYDPYSSTSYGTFAMLSNLWMCFSQRINGSDGEKSTFKPEMTQRFCTHFFTCTLRYTHFCNMIWNIVDSKFQYLRSQLEEPNRPGQIIAESYSNTMSVTNEKSEAKKCWKFLLHCSHTIKCIINPTVSNQNVISKCCAAFLNLMFDIVKSIDLKPIEYDRFSDWLIELADKDMAAEEEVGKNIFRLIKHISSKTESPLVFAKFVALDYFNHCMLANEDGDDVMMPQRTDQIESTIQFQLFDKDTSLVEYQKLINQVISEKLDEFKWMLNVIQSKNGTLNKNKCLVEIFYQLDIIVLTIFYIFKSVANAQTAELNLDIMIKFYEFMAFFLQLDMLKVLDAERLRILRSLIYSIANSLQSNLSPELNRIKNFIILDEQQNVDKVDSSQIISILKYKQLMMQLIDSIDTFEQTLLKLSDIYRNKIYVNLVENYKVFISSLQFNFKSKITRTVSEQEINDIYQHNLL